ncbi:MAG TPA: CoA transferase [Bordetella sp.]|nr:CoA transferase [Bordetella sp.]
MTHSTSDRLPLAGIKVVDATRVLAGPYCSYLLALLGATVIRVERPPGGDSIRWRSRANPELGAQGLSTDYIAQACNKEVMFLELSDARDRERFLQFIADADVLVENFRTGALDRLGLDEATVRARNPGLVWCSITGYGRAGPRGEYPAYDSVIQAASGLMQLSGTPASGPTKTGAPIIDYTTGLNAALGVVSAVLANVRNPGNSGGSRISVSMLDTALAMMQSTVTGYLNGKESLAPRGNAASSGNLLSRAYKAIDGEVCLAVNEPHQLRGLLATLRIDADEATPGLMTSQALLDEVSQRIATWPTADLDRALNSAGVPCAPVQGLDAALHAARQADPAIVQSVPGGSGRHYLGLPFSMDGDRGTLAREPATLKPDRT